MAQYVFQCCGRTANVADTSAPTVVLQHLCLNDTPCYGMALSTVNVVAAMLNDVQTEVVDPVTGQVDGTDTGTSNNGDGQ